MLPPSGLQQQDNCDSSYFKQTAYQQINIQ